MLGSRLILMILLIVAVLILVIGVGNLGDKAKGFFSVGGKAVSSNFGATEKPGGTLDLTIYPEGEFVLKPDSPVDVISDTTTLRGFIGEIRVDFSKGELKFTDSRTSLMLSLKPKDIEFGSILKINKLKLDNTKMIIIKDGWKKSVDNTTVEVDGFTGQVKLATGYIQFIGNVTKFVEKR